MSKSTLGQRVSWDDGKPIMTSPWSTANRVDNFDFDSYSYPSLKGMKAMLIIPNDFYRKKLMGLGPGYIGEAMMRCEIDVSITDCSIYSYDDIELAKILIESGVKIFGIGALYPMFKEVERLCGIIRAVVPDATIILGGSLPSPIPEFALRQTGADIVTIGEAELTIPRVMAALAGEENIDDVPGICFFRDGEFVDNGKPTLPKKVTRKEVGWARYELYPAEKYITWPKFHPFNQDDRVLPISTGRGCPYACNFCFRVTAYRIRPADDILDEMEYLVDRYNLNAFYINDDLLMLSDRKIRDFCTGILDRGLKIRFSCTGRVNIVTPEIIQLLKDAGCVSIYYGLESGNDEVLQTISKKTNLEQIHHAVRLTKEAGIYTEFGTMFGQPGETEETLKDTVQLMKDLAYGEYRAQKIFGCVPFPGTGLYDWCKKTGRIKDDKDFYDRYICQDWSLDQVPVNMTDFSDEKVKELFVNANKDLSEFYLERMSYDWVKQFGGDVAGFQDSDVIGKAMSKVAYRVEATAQTHDTSGRT